MIYLASYELLWRIMSWRYYRIMLEHKDYLSSLNKAEKKKRDQRLDPRYLVLLLAAIAAVGNHCAGG